MERFPSKGDQVHFPFTRRAYRRLLKRLREDANNGPEEAAFRASAPARSSGGLWVVPVCESPKGLRNSTRWQRGNVSKESATHARTELLEEEKNGAQELARTLS